MKTHNYWGKTIASFLQCALILLPAIVSASETRSTKRESNLFVTASINSRQSIKPFDIFVIPAGTEVELLSRVNYYASGDFVRVKLQDGSMGFMPTVAFADATVNLSDETVKLEVGGNALPEGSYQVQIKTPWRYSPEEKVYSSYQSYAEPSGRTSLRAKNGKTYVLDADQTYDEVRISEKGNRYTAYRLRPIHAIFKYGDFQQDLENLPRGDGLNVQFIPRFDAAKKDLNSFVGCSRSYLETLFGSAYAYVGPALSNIPGYTYALYRNVSWKDANGNEEGGIVVYYDKDLCARRLVTRPFGIPSGADDAPLYFPKHPLAQPATDLDAYIGEASAKYFPMKKEWEPVTEVFSKPGGVDGICISAMLFFERTLGIKSPFAILGILLLLELLFVGFVILWIRYIFNYGSNKWAVARCFYLMVPMIALIVAYLWRYPILYVIFGIIVAGALALIPYMALRETIKYKRCSKCHKYCNPIILETHEGCYHGDNYKKTPMFEQMEVQRGSGSDGAFHDVFYYKYETTMEVTQEMEYYVKCPHCGHEWTQEKVEPRPSQPGPILIIQEHDEQTAEHYEKTTTTTLKDGYGNTLEEHEDVEHSVVNNRRRYQYLRYDYDFFKPYFTAFFTNGDQTALKRYYEDRWNTITWQELYSPFRTRR